MPTNVLSLPAAPSQQRSRNTPAVARFYLRLRAVLNAPSLDRRLAEGADPAADPALAERAARLLAKRARLSDALERLSNRPRGGLSAAIPVERHALTVARPAIEQLARALRSREAVDPRGVALTQILLTEPGSPLYCPAHRDALYEAVREALLALDLPPQRGRRPEVSA